ncbi:MAG: 50S ribosomal protein L4 [bacterium]|nr:50S ribosomal protein L4 [bacterium]MDZ4295893.1 50S ribosomal protein L4 [Patescibacteria group bacterium]
MMTVNLYNQQGERVGTAELPDAVFALPWNGDLVHQAVVAQQANARRPWAHVKTRGEVRGGGKKPWRQKGTGRARHGSIRSPIWVGGGVTHGPRNERDYTKKLNIKMRRKAMLTALSRKVKDNELVLLEALTLEKPKTKEAATVIGTLARKQVLTLRKNRRPDVLVLIEGKNEVLARALRNIPYVKTTAARNLNVTDLMTYKYVLMPKAAVEVVAKTFAKK